MTTSDFEIEPCLRIGEVCAVEIDGGFRLAYITSSTSELITEIRLAGTQCKWRFDEFNQQLVKHLSDPALRLAARMLADAEWSPGMVYESAEHLKSAIRAKSAELERQWK